MPVLKSAKKALKQDARRTGRNKAAMSAFRTALKQVNAAVESGDREKVKAALPKALSLIGRSAKKGIIHPKKAARQESRLMKKVNALLGEG
jgi:small subunit ribosomal protein S20